METAEKGSKFPDNKQQNILLHAQLKMCGSDWNESSNVKLQNATIHVGYSVRNKIQRWTRKIKREKASNTFGLMMNE
jgi:hypothetical protein